MAKRKNETVIFYLLVLAMGIWAGGYIGVAILAMRYTAVIDALYAYSPVWLTSPIRMFIGGILGLITAVGSLLFYTYEMNSKENA